MLSMTGNEGARIVLQPRDKHLLEELVTMRVIDREQAKLVARFGSTTRANARLLALHRVGLVHRFFQGTAAGGKKALYALSTKGARLIGAPTPPKLRYGNDELLATNFFVAHQLQVNSVYCTVRYRPIPFSDVSFARWLNFPQPIAPRLTPDGYFELKTPDSVLGSFVEVDLGYEGSAVWREKTQSYLRYAASGEFPKRFHQTRFRVLVMANRESRVLFLSKLIGHFTDKIFWLANFESIDQDAFWSSSWRRPSDAAPKFLI
jgi:Replication-relaxation